uniref:Chymotrypsinogen A-like isoform X1 n=1 Tax=Callorhinus ursinus TaxID=34884 RepID=A0A3Q7PNR1_CALUR|nr:chymotrypsinogen A-like isoform X1 [Callorhinus ursinus]
MGTQVPISGEFVSVICLPGKDDKVNLFSKCLTAGWGITEPHQDEFSKTVQEAVVPLINSTSCRSYWGLDIKNTNTCGGAVGSSSCMVIPGCTDECGFLLSVSHQWVFADHKKVAGRFWRTAAVCP